MACKYETSNGRCGLKDSYAYRHKCYTEDMCKCNEPPTNADRIRGNGEDHATCEWISVQDRLPEDQEEVLVCTRSKNGIRNIDKGYMALDRFIHRGCAEVTHWMPLPKPPKGE